jgi:MraZ protein
LTWKADYRYSHFRWFPGFLNKRLGDIKNFSAHGGISMTEIRPLTFQGNFPHALDDKGRLMLPSALRDELHRVSDMPERLYLSYFPGKQYLSLYTFEKWKEQSVIWSQEDRFPSTAVRIAAQRLFFSNIEQVLMDKAGRILIPSNYRDRIGLAPGQKVLVNGIGGRVEIWSPEAYTANELKDMELFKAAQEIDAQRGLQSLSEMGRLPEC